MGTCTVCCSEAGAGEMVSLAQLAWRHRRRRSEPQPPPWYSSAERYALCVCAELLLIASFRLFSKSFTDFAPPEVLRYHTPDASVVRLRNLCFCAEVGEKLEKKEKLSKHCRIWWIPNMHDAILIWSLFFWLTPEDVILLTSINNRNVIIFDHSLPGIQNCLSFLILNRVSNPTVSDTLAKVGYFVCGGRLTCLLAGMSATKQEQCLDTKALKHKCAPSKRLSGGLIGCLEASLLSSVVIFQPSWSGWHFSTFTSLPQSVLYWVDFIIGMIGEGNEPVTNGRCWSNIHALCKI